MLAWLKTAQGMLATFAAALAIMATWWQLGLPRLVFWPEQMSDTLPIDLNSAALGIGRHVTGIADPFSGHIDEFQPPRSTKAASRHRLQVGVWWFA